MGKIFKKIHYNSPVVLTFTFISMIVIALSFFTNGDINLMFFSIYRSPFSIGFVVRLFGHIIGHVDLNHFVSNFVIILLIGPMLEEKYGSILLLTMILTTALITGGINLIFTNNILLGASGIAYMLMILTSFANIENNKVPLTFILIVCIYIGGEIFLGITASDNISHITHIAGGICGAILGFYINNVFSKDKKKLREEDENKKEF